MLRDTAVIKIRFFVEIKVLNYKLTESNIGTV